MVRVSFALGTIEISGLPEDTDLLPEGCRWDERSSSHRAEAVDYAEVILALRDAGVRYEDRARAYDTLRTGLRTTRTPRPYQSEALAAWTRARGRGVVVLPTGAGKSYLALMAMDSRPRSTLVVAPTLDLVRQWYDLLRVSFQTRVGVIGGGEYDLQPITVTTYDSAYIHMEHLGNRFGMVVFDEVHHLPGSSYALAARGCLAPFRLGLTATPERSDGRERDLDRLVGPTVYRVDIHRLSGEFLAEYRVERVVVRLTREEREEYERERAIYLDFVRSRGIRMSSPEGWTRFVIESATSPNGRRAMEAYRRQREIAFSAEAKLDYLEHLLHEHRKDRVILFTQDNATAYRISRRFLLPVITHHTKVKERSEILERFSGGVYRAVVTSKVLNEGVDVPEARVAVVISGSGSVREHVQRLGRVLRKKGDQQAILYELVSEDTSEAFTSERRRDHVAYRGPGQGQARQG